MARSPEMAERTDLAAVGARIEALLDELQSSLDPRSWTQVTQVIALVTDLYGGGLGRVLELTDDNRKLLDKFADDDLVSSLLALHGLHPQPLRARVDQALDSVRPYLESHGGGVHVLDLDEDAGAVWLRMMGSCDGCPSSAATLEDAVRRAIEEAAPEIVRVDVVGAEPSAASTPVTLQTKPAAAMP